jgi:hypothetical protein
VHPVPRHSRGKLVVGAADAAAHDPRPRPGIPGHPADGEQGLYFFNPSVA